MNGKTRAKNHAAVKKMAWHANEPEFKIMDYKGSLVKCLNFYNIEVPSKDKQAWAVNYWKNQDKPTKGLEKLSDGYFTQVGALIRIMERGYDLEPQHVKYLENKYHELYARVQRNEEDAASKPKVQSSTDTVQAQLALAERQERLVRGYAAEFDNALDEMCHGGTKFDPKSFLSTNQVKATFSKSIADGLKHQLKEFEEAAKGKCAQLTEAYSYLSKRDMKRVIDFLTMCINECSNMAVIAKTTRKPRARKERPASVVAAKLQYLKDYPELNMKSVPGEKIVGATFVVLFDTKYRKLIQYESVGGTTLTIKGTTLMNIDPEKSYSKTIRKVEVLKDIQKMGKRPYNALIKGVKAVEAKVTGRINDNQIILLVF